MTLYFPPNPSNRQRYVGTNGVTYTWLTDRWNSGHALTQGIAEYYEDNGDATFQYNPDIDDELDGGTA